MSYWYAAPFGDDSNSGRSFGRAKRSIQAAIDLAGDDETVRVHHGAYHEALTISRPLEVVVYRPSKAWGAAILEGPGGGAGLTVSGLSGTQSVRFIGFRMAGWETGVAGANAGGILTAYGLHLAPGVSYGINPSGLGSVRAWSCTFEEQLCALGGADALQAEVADARGCTFFDCARSIAVGDGGVLCRWRNCIMANAGAAVRHVELDQRVAFEADFNLYAGARPSAGYFTAGGVDYATDGDYDARWTAFQDIHSPPRNGEAAFVRTVA